MSESQEGQRVPQVIFKTRVDHDWVDVSTDDIFSGRTIVLFALPGAYTPTCSSTHVPRFNKLAPVLKRHGVDEIVCLSVNDAYVMNEWKENQRADNITFLPDGNGDFSRGMGMLVSKQDMGFGERSKRYSMLVEDGVIRKIFIEPDGAAGPLQQSDADTMLAYLAPDAEKPLDVTVFTRKGCPFCARAKTLLAEAGIDYDELVLNRDFPEASIRAVSGEASLPQVFIDGRRIGGCDALEAYLAEKPG
jgi:glutaredoxin-like protein